MRNANDERTDDARLGPAVFENWRAFSRGAPSLGAKEYPLFTDAQITGNWTHDVGPYRLLNTGAGSAASQPVRAAIVLRVDFHVDPDELDRRPLNVTDDSTYHGGELGDEVAALVSLACGIRLKAGGVSRVIRRNDERGHPVFSRRDPPALLRDHEIRPALNADDRIIASVFGEHSVAIEDVLQQLAQLDRAMSIAVIRSARLYQDAVWVAESQPHLTWLFFVSALETAANAWRSAHEPAVQRLQAARPELYDHLISVGGIDHAAFVAEQITDSIGATRKFREFVLSFLPDPPTRRPPEPQQLDWTASAVRKMLSTIYGYRSQALHAGKPFPEPMCQPMWNQPNWAAPAEKPPYASISSKGGAWLAEDLPISLNAFEYLVRRTMLNWWASLSN